MIIKLQHSIYETESQDVDPDDVVEQARRLVFNTPLCKTYNAGAGEIDENTSSMKTLEGSYDTKSRGRLYLKNDFRSSADASIIDNGTRNEKSLHRDVPNLTDYHLQINSKEPPPKESVEKVNQWLHSSKEENQLVADDSVNYSIETDDSGKRDFNNNYLDKIFCNSMSMRLAKQRRLDVGFKTRLSLNRFTASVVGSSHVSAFKRWNYFCRSGDLSDEARKGTVLEGLTEGEVEELLKQKVIMGEGGVYESPVLLSLYGRFGIRGVSLSRPLFDYFIGSLLPCSPSESSDYVVDASSKDFQRQGLGCFANNPALFRQNSAVSPSKVSDFRSYTGEFAPNRTGYRNIQRYSRNHRADVQPPPPSIFTDEEYTALSLHISKYALSCEDKTHLELIAWLILNERKIGLFHPRDVDSMVIKLVQYTGNLCAKEAQLKNQVEGCLERDGDLNYYKSWQK